jgi:hypothetical protein
MAECHPVGFQWVMEAKARLDHGEHSVHTVRNIRRWSVRR